MWVRSAVLRTPCQNELTTNGDAGLAIDDPLAKAHSLLSGILAERASTFGVYALSPVSSLQVLSDLRVLSARMLAAIALEDVDAFLSAGRRTSIRARLMASSMDPRRWGEPEVFTARAPALISGIGIALALRVLGAESIRQAGDHLRSVIGRPGAGKRMATPDDVRSGRLSPALEAVQLSALSDHFSPSNQLRFRTVSEFPRCPGSGDQQGDGLAIQSIPSALWRDWSLRLVARQRIHLDIACSSLSVLLLIIGTRTSVNDACVCLGGEVRWSQQSMVLKYLRRNPLWQNIATAIIRLHDYLAAHPSPIDYQRRRQLNYKDLLPTEVWTDICKGAGLIRHDGDRSAQLARSWLFERISGRAADMSSLVGGSARARGNRDELVQRFTPDVIRALDGQAGRFLYAHGIVDEPICWSPPLNLISDLELPGPDPAVVSISELHLALGVKEMTVAAAARHFGVATPVIRLLLERFPPGNPPVRQRSWNDSGPT
jgi:hypothetical protein